jgi:hypothetical protein
MRNLLWLIASVTLFLACASRQPSTRPEPTPPKIKISQPADHAIFRPDREIECSGEVVISEHGTKPDAVVVEVTQGPTKFQQRNAEWDKTEEGLAYRFKVKMSRLGHPGKYNVRAFAMVAVTRPAEATKGVSVKESIFTYSAGVPIEVRLK